MFFGLGAMYLLPTVAQRRVSAGSPDTVRLENGRAKIQGVLFRNLCAPPKSGATLKADITSRMHLVLLGMQNRAFDPYLAAINSMWPARSF
jgi:hypothetical protein